MSTHFHCDDTETLVAYLYDEIDTETRAAVKRHLPACARCQADLASLGGVRQVLTEWSPPAPDLRFTVVPETAATSVVRPAVPAWQTVPRWAQAIAAMLALAVGASVANVQVRHDASGWTVSTGWMTPAPTASAAETADAAAREPWRPALVSLEESLRSEFRAQPGAIEPVPTAVTTAATSESVTMARLQSLIEASEKRQQQELALRLAQFGSDVDLQRRADLVRIDQGFGQLEGRTGAEVARQREVLNFIVRAGLRPPQ